MRCNVCPGRVGQCRHKIKDIYQGDPGRSNSRNWAVKGPRWRSTTLTRQGRWNNNGIIVTASSTSGWESQPVWDIFQALTVLEGKHLQADLRRVNISKYFVFIENISLLIQVSSLVEPVLDLQPGLPQHTELWPERNIRCKSSVEFYKYDWF